MNTKPFFPVILIGLVAEAASGLKKKPSIPKYLVASQS
jgi:hypothetical protein